MLLSLLFSCCDGHRRPSMSIANVRRSLDPSLAHHHTIVMHCEHCETADAISLQEKHASITSACAGPWRHDDPTCPLDDTNAAANTTKCTPVKTPAGMTMPSTREPASASSLGPAHRSVPWGEAQLPVLGRRTTSLSSPGCSRHRLGIPVYQRQIVLRNGFVWTRDLVQGRAQHHC